jgi:hypothetical protein
MVWHRRCAIVDAADRSRCNTASASCTIGSGPVFRSSSSFLPSLTFPLRRSSIPARLLFGRGSWASRRLWLAQTPTGWYWRVSSEEERAKLLREAKRACALIAASQHDQEAAEVWKDRKRQEQTRLAATLLENHVLPAILAAKSADHCLLAVSGSSSLSGDVFTNINSSTSTRHGECAFALHPEQCYAHKG